MLIWSSLDLATVLITFVRYVRANLRKYVTARLADRGYPAASHRQICNSAPALADPSPSAPAPAPAPAAAPAGPAPALALRHPPYAPSAPRFCCCPRPRPPPPPSAPTVSPPPSTPAFPSPPSAPAPSAPTQEAQADDGAAAAAARGRRCAGADAAPLTALVPPPRCISVAMRIKSDS